MYVRVPVPDYIYIVPRQRKFYDSTAHGSRVWAGLSRAGRAQPESVASICQSCCLTSSFPSLHPPSPPVTALLHCAAGCVWLNTLISSCHVIALVGKVVQKVILPLTAVEGPKERKGKLAMCFLIFNYNKFDLLCQSLLAHTHTLVERGRKVEARSCAVTKMN